MELLHGDCLELMKDIPDKSVDLICTDIPYELENHGGTKSELAKRSARMRDSVEFIAHGIDYENVFNEYIRICKIPNMIIFCSNLQIGKIITFFNERKLKTELLVWEKTNPAPLCNGKYVSDLEYIIYVHTKGSPFNNELDRDFIGIELDDNYFEIAKNRIEQAQKDKESMLFPEVV